MDCVPVQIRSTGVIEKNKAGARFMAARTIFQESKHNVFISSQSGFTLDPGECIPCSKDLKCLFLSKSWCPYIGWFKLTFPRVVKFIRITDLFCFSWPSVLTTEAIRTLLLLILMCLNNQDITNSFAIPK